MTEDKLPPESSGTMTPMVLLDASASADTATQNSQITTAEAPGRR
jgi:hypothetical protein